MVFHDPPANGQTQSKAVRFCRHERSKQARNAVLWKTGPAISDFDRDTVVPGVAGPHLDPARKRPLFLDCIQSVANKVEDDLFDLHAVRMDAREIASETCFYDDTEALRLGMEQVEGVSDDRVGVDFLTDGLPSPDEFAKPPDDRIHPVRLLEGIRERGHKIPCAASFCTSRLLKNP